MYEGVKGKPTAHSLLVPPDDGIWPSRDLASHVPWMWMDDGTA
jgi:hypothetical protein